MLNIPAKNVYSKRHFHLSPGNEALRNGHMHAETSNDCSLRKAKLSDI